MRTQKIKNKWLVLGAINILGILFSAMMIYCSHQDEVGAALSYLDEGNSELSYVYSTSEMKKGVYEAEISYKIGGGGSTDCPVTL